MNPSLPQPVASADCLRIDLQACHNKTSLMDCLVRELQLPAWFGRNWDALADVLVDLSWLQPLPRCIEFCHASGLAQQAPAVFATLSWIIEDSNRLWEEDGLEIWLDSSDCKLPLGEVADTVVSEDVDLGEPGGSGSAAK